MTDQPKKVFCGECKYFYEQESHQGIEYFNCKHKQNMTFETDAIGKIEYYGHCKSLNANNDCPKFEKKKSLIEKVMGIFR